MNYSEDQTFAEQDFLEQTEDIAGGEVANFESAPEGAADPLISQCLETNDETFSGDLAANISDG